MPKHRTGKQRVHTYLIGANGIDDSAPPDPKARGPTRA